MPVEHDSAASTPPVPSGVARRATSRNDLQMVEEIVSYLSQVSKRKRKRIVQLLAKLI